MLVVTMDSLPGFALRAILGEVVGVTARPQNKFTEGARSLTGALSEAGEQTLIAGRREAVERMAYHAREMGANAVLAMRFDHRVISATWVEICAYGTAVIAVPRSRVSRSRPTRAIEAPSPPPVPPPPAMYEAALPETPFS